MGGVKKGGSGCILRDVDGNEYIDFMCSYGPIVLGHRHPKVEEAAMAQHAKVDCQNFPSEKWVELAELLVSITPAADWATFAKGGSDVTSWALRVARAHVVLQAVRVRDECRGHKVLNNNVSSTIPACS